MTDRRTVTDTSRERAGHRRDPRPVLIVAWHPDERAIGARRHLAPGDAVVLGRDGDAFGAGVLADERVSARHAEVAVDRGRVVVRDLGSRNGTRVDGRPIAEAELPVHGVLALGRVLFVLERGPADWPDSDVPGLVGGSPALVPLLEQLDAAAPQDATVLVTGETGTGKELVARELHRRSGRPGPFVAVNCAAFGDAVLHSELFGHERGAFTGADRARTGLVEQADAGTLFLDEIGEASPALQASLLRVLQEREVRAVGSNRVIAVGTRFVAATHRDLQDAAGRGAFRTDLYARLAQWVLMVPPLRERRSDIPRIAAAAASAAAGRPVRVARALAHHLLLRPWPHHVRELVAFVRQVLARNADAEVLQLPEALSEVPTRSATPADPAPPAARSRPDPTQMRDRVRRLHGNLAAYATELRIGRSTLYRWLREAGIEPASLRED